MHSLCLEPVSYKDAIAVRFTQKHYLWVLLLLDFYLLWSFKVRLVKLFQRWMSDSTPVVCGPVHIQYCLPVSRALFCLLLWFDCDFHTDRSWAEAAWQEQKARKWFVNIWDRFVPVMPWSSISHTAVGLCIKLSRARLQFWPQTYFLHSLTLDQTHPHAKIHFESLGSTYSSSMVCLAKSQASSCWSVEDSLCGSLSVWDNEPPGNYRANFDHPLHESASSSWQSHVHNRVPGVLDLRRNSVLTPWRNVIFGRNSHTVHEYLCHSPMLTRC